MSRSTEWFGIAYQKTHVGSQTLGIGVASAIITFNDGLQQIEQVFKRQNMNPGKFTSQTLAKLDEKRIDCAERQNLSTTKQRRKALWRRKKGYEDNLLDQEGVVYEAGMGDDL